MAQDVWNPDQYARFRAERSQPFYDLLALVQRRPGMRVVDLGCGTGELTRVLHERLQAVETLGLDNSAAMLAESRQLAGGGLRFEPGDIGDFDSVQRFDLVFSNAALQWVPDHKGLLARITGGLESGGQLAVQVPANDDHPSHRLAAELAAEPPFLEALGGYVRRSHILAPGAYAALLERLGYVEQHVRLQVYGHHLASREEVIEWVKGTLLTDYRRRIPADLYERMLDEYRQRLLPQLDDARPYFYPFKRILFWARRDALDSHPG
ncbi:MAG: methyltransferase domain-containing protein [Chloroflexota bacterium]